MRQLSFTFITLFLLSVTACKKPKENSPAPNQSALTDQEVEQYGKKISENLTVLGGVKKDGMPPAPNTNSMDIVGPSSLSTEFVESGNTISFAVEFESSDVADVAGLYVGVVGGDSYFELPKVDGGRRGLKSLLPMQLEAKQISSTAQRTMGGRTSKMDSTGINVGIVIPPGTPTGQFCVEYCPFNTNGQIGQIVTRCYNVIKRDAGFSTEILGKWNIQKYYDYSGTLYDGFSISVGQNTNVISGKNKYWYFDTTTNQVVIDSTSYGSYTINQKFNSASMDFSTTGMALAYNFDISYLNMYAQCSSGSQGMNYIGDTTYSELGSFNGTWSYDTASGLLNTVMLQTEPDVWVNINSCTGYEVEVDSSGINTMDTVQYGMLKKFGNSIVILDQYGVAYEMSK